jgi:hypothetical protein
MPTRSIQLATRFNRYEVCKILFYFIRQNMVEAGSDAADDSVGNADDVDFNCLSVKQIKRNRSNSTTTTPRRGVRVPSQHIGDEVVRTAARALRNFFLDACSAPVFETHIDTAHDVEPMARYLKTRADAERRELLDFIAFTFAESVDIPDVACRRPSDRRSVRSRVCGDE